MVQEQLTDYISSQIKLGVSREAIKSALVSAGWVAGDVEDTLKKVDGGTTGAVVGGMAGVATGAVAVTRPSSMPSGQPASSMGGNMGSGSMGAAKPMGGMPGSSMKSSDPQMIRVSDLVSSSPSGSGSTSPAMMAGGSGAAASQAKSKDAFFGGKISGNSFQATPTSGAGASAVAASRPKGGKGAMMGAIVAGVLAVLFAVAAWYFYSGNAGLAAQVASLTTQSNSVASQLSSLKSQVDASSTSMEGQISTLTNANANLALDLSFYAVPPGGSSSTAATALPISVSGLLSDGGRAPFAITTAEGAKIFVANSSDATTVSELKPLVGQTVQLSGTYVPGSDQMTMSSVSSSTT